MNPETPRQEVDGRHPFDQGVSAMHWDGVLAEINARTPRLPEIDIEISETIPSEGVVLFDSAVDAPKAEEKAAEGRIARAKEALAMFGETLKLPELKPLAVPALAVAVAACSPAGGTPTAASNHPEATPSPIVTSAPTAEASKTPFPGTGNTYPEVTPSPTPTPKPSAEVTPTPEPTPTPKPKSVKPTNDKISQVLNDNPGATDTSGDSQWTEKTYLDEWKFCQKGNPKILGDINTNKEANCVIFIRKMTENANQYTDVRFLNLAIGAYDWAIKNLPKEYHGDLEQFSYLEDL